MNARADRKREPAKPSSRPPRRRRKKTDKTRNSIKDRAQGPKLAAVAANASDKNDAETATPVWDDAAQERALVHLKFIHRHRRVLKLPINAAEDLLLNGAKPPENQGVVTHLLRKVDRATVEQALGRMVETAERQKFLAGVAAFSPDAHILVLYLEELLHGVGKGAASPLVAEALAALKPESVSCAIGKRLAELVGEVFPKESWQGLAWRWQLPLPTDDETLPDAHPFVAKLAASLNLRQRLEAGLFGWVADAQQRHEDMATLQGLLQGDGALLASLPVGARCRILEASAVFLPAHADVDCSLDHSLKALWVSLPKSSRDRGQTGMRLATRFLAHEPSEPLAQELLSTLVADHPGFHLPKRWLSWLEQPRMGRVALRCDGQEQTGAWPGWDISSQRKVWLCLDVDAEAVAFWHKIRAMHPALPLLPVLAHGQDPWPLSDGQDETPKPAIQFWAAVAAGEVMLLGSPTAPPTRTQHRLWKGQEALRIWQQAVRFLAALSEAGWALPRGWDWQDVGVDGQGVVWLVRPQVLQSASGDARTLGKHIREIWYQLAPRIASRRMPAPLLRLLALEEDEGLLGALREDGWV